MFKAQAVCILHSPAYSANSSSATHLVSNLHCVFPLRSFPCLSYLQSLPEMAFQNYYNPVFHIDSTELDSP